MTTVCPVYVHDTPTLEWRCPDCGVYNHGRWRGDLLRPSRRDKERIYQAVKACLDGDHSRCPRGCTGI